MPKERYRRRQITVVTFFAMDLKSQISIVDRNFSLAPLPARTCGFLLIEEIFPEKHQMIKKT